MDGVEDVEERHQQEEHSQLPVRLCRQASHQETVEQEGCGWGIWEEGDPVGGPVVLVATQVQHNGRNQHNAC